MLKQYHGERTIITAYPDKSNLKPSTAQLAGKALFTNAVAYAKGIRNQLEAKQETQSRLALRKGSLYHALIAKYWKTASD
ncbi:MAG: hypothetical protein ABIP95_00755 [Pelobium sp.]